MFNCYTHGWSHMEKQCPACFQLMTISSDSAKINAIVGFDTNEYIKLAAERDELKSDRDKFFDMYHEANKENTQLKQKCDVMKSVGEMKIIDLSSGNRAVWFNKNHPLAIYLDKRPEVSPTIVCDTRDIPESVGYGFNLVCWDPPHMNCGPNSNMSRSYGYHTTKEILDTIEKTGSGVHKITAENALMALKWNTHDIKLERIFKLLPDWEPLFGHLIKDGPRSQTYWVMLRRLGGREGTTEGSGK